MTNKAWLGAMYVESVEHLPVGILESAGFSKDAEELLNEEQLVELNLNLASNPRAGRLMPRTGGLRKLRLAASGKGKRAGARVIYYYHSTSIPILLLAIYAKNEKIDLTVEEVNQIRTLVREIVKHHMRSKLRVIRNVCKE